MISIIDYGMGNLGSIINAFRRIGVPAKVASEPDAVLEATKLVLPGVGSFKRGMANLNAAGLTSALEEQVLENHVPILGICLGMQLLSRTSEEGDARGLGWIEGDTVRFQLDSSSGRRRVPHMGWNSIDPIGGPLLANITRDDRFYFVHSFHLADVDEEWVTGTTSYGYRFPSAVSRDNIHGIQCHPERSHASGVRVLKNFVNLP